VHGRIPCDSLCSHAGGGGERVLWCALQTLASVRDPRHLRVVIYTGDVGVSHEAFLAQARDRFGVDIPDLQLRFVYVHNRHLLEASK
jgi:alpha-1,2-mannosyltransferase